MSCAMLSPKSSTSLKALVDINLFEDVFRKRMGWRASEAVIRAVRRGKVIGYISALTVPILYFFRSHSHSETEARRLTKTITRKFRVVALTDSILRDAFDSPLSDFEDAIQFYSAKSVKSDYLVTRNVAHFSLPDVKVITPEDFLALISP